MIITWVKKKNEWNMTPMILTLTHLCVTTEQETVYASYYVILKSWYRSDAVYFLSHFTFLATFLSQYMIKNKNILIMKTRKTQIKWVTERYSNTREMRRYTLTLKRKIQAGLMMVPPHRLSPWQKGFTPQHRTAEAQPGDNTQPRLIKHKSLFFFLEGER